MSQENLVSMQCTECKRINYRTNKNKKQRQELLELKKFCGWCRKHIPHKEKKK